MENKQICTNISLDKSNVDNILINDELINNNTNLKENTDLKEDTDLKENSDLKEDTNLKEDSDLKNTDLKNTDLKDTDLKENSDLKEDSDLKDSDLKNTFIKNNNKNMKFLPVSLYYIDKNSSEKILNINGNFWNYINIISNKLTYHKFRGYCYVFRQCNH
jgi:hypothetical protein